MNEKLKIEAAKELGLFEKVLRVGWSNLTAQETGKIGAIVKKRKKHITL
ncbi:small, acid-soluble spore protein, alpha/beta type [Thermoanaerobacterium sp. RBIITD]|nr:small, acid-soluble spore protein, alpha/beta type [Thermoanaerobacterium sp. RBIITD]SNX54984.1 Small, acid-soluble spore protein, alpha/beta type [Thermoanaerobacterium sp. RBIITD]